MGRPGRACLVGQGRGPAPLPGRSGGTGSDPPPDEARRGASLGSDRRATAADDCGHRAEPLPHPPHPAGVCRAETRQAPDSVPGGIAPMNESPEESSLEELFLAYWDNTLTDAQAAELNRRLAIDAEARDAFEAFCLHAVAAADLLVA